jgi:hypothetical protein
MSSIWKRFLIQSCDVRFSGKYSLKSAVNIAWRKHFAYFCLMVNFQYSWCVMFVLMAAVSDMWQATSGSLSGSWDTLWQ